MGIRAYILSPKITGGHVNPIGPRSCYDEAKRCAETLFFDYRRQHRLPIKVARIFNTYGPRMHPNDGRVVSNFIVQALLGRDITVYGEGSQTRSFCYVDDLVDGLIRLMASPTEVTGPRQPRGIFDSGIGDHGDPVGWLPVAHRSSPASAGRSEATPARHFAGPGITRLAATY
jgi:nucleoside-diphosphate-sugar epimerase